LADPLIVVEFLPGSRIYREPKGRSGLAIVRNGPPGTYVLLPFEGWKVSLPTDLIVHATNEDGAAKVTFGGLQFQGPQLDRLVFKRVHDLLPLEALSPERGTTMKIELRFVSAVYDGEDAVWRAMPEDDT
jgi:hypothetical protein